MEQSFIKETVEQLLLKLCVNARFLGVSELNNGEILKFSVTTDEPYLLVGDGGRALMALNHVMKKIYERQREKKSLGDCNFMIDVNDYQERRIGELRTKATIMAERARFFKSNVELDPMNPYERMIVHSFFSGVPDIETESTGEGRDRRVVIKYIESPLF